MQISNNYNSGNFFSTDLNFKSKKPNLVILKNSRSMKEIAAELIFAPSVRVLSLQSYPV